MTTETYYYYEEKVGDDWISCGFVNRWTLDQCRKWAMERKIVSPRSVLRIVKTTKTVWEWRERRTVE